MEPWHGKYRKIINTKNPRFLQSFNVKKVRAHRDIKRFIL